MYIQQKLFNTLLSSKIPMTIKGTSFELKTKVLKQAYLPCPGNIGRTTLECRVQHLYSCAGDVYISWVVCLTKFCCVDLETASA